MQRTNECCEIFCDNTTEGGLAQCKAQSFYIRYWLTWFGLACNSGWAARSSAGASKRIVGAPFPSRRERRSILYPHREVMNTVKTRHGVLVVMVLARWRVKI